ncbi:MAG: hypothetical protein Q8O09_00535, partial [Bacillota bacterium]|nr:hypothetical protein [Bacillota bacterium]
MKNKMLKFLLRILTLIVCAAVLTGCTVALALNVQDTQTPLPSTGEQNNPITSVDVFRGMRDEQSGFLYTFSDKAQTQIIYNAMNKCEKLPGLMKMTPADYTLIVNYIDNKQEVYLWLGENSGMLAYADNPGKYRINDSEYRELRSLFNDIIVPIEELQDLPNTSDLELILKYPPLDKSIPPTPEGLGCYTVEGREAMDNLLNNADGRIDFVLPEDKDLILEEAIIRSSINIYVKYHDGLTGNTLLFDAHKSNIDFIPEEMKWEMVKYSDQTFYRRTINNDIGLNYTSLYWEKNGWTFVLNIAGEAAQSDIERYINLETISYNADKKMLDWDDLIVEG